MNLYGQYSYSKESIKNRILQNAIKIWGVKDLQSLDPLVKLLVDAFSAEIFKSNNEIQNVNTRILEKLSRTLIPARYSHASPAHAIAYTKSNEDKEILFDTAEFIYKKKINNSLRKDETNQQAEVPFTPIDNVELINAQTCLLFTESTVYEVDEYLTKNVIWRVRKRDSVVRYRKIDIALDFSDYLADVYPESFDFYCSNSTFEHIDFVYRLLPYVKVTCNGKELKVYKGRRFLSEELQDGYEGIFQEQSIRFKLKEDIKNFYNHKFLEISGFNKIIFETESEWPKEIDKSNPVFEQYLEKKLIWLSFEFPPQFSSEIIENFLFTLNTFPVYNRGFKNSEISLDFMVNYIPLIMKEKESFLYVNNVEDSLGNMYKEIPFISSRDKERGIYTIRNGGMERFNERNSVDQMLYLMEQIRDEVAAFSVFDRDKVKTLLGTMSDEVKGIGNKINRADGEIKDEINYVIIEPLVKAEHSKASFCITNCSFANHLRPGLSITSQSETHSITLLTETTGGMEAQKRTDSILAYKYALTSRDKLISKEDIKNYCKLILGDQIKRIVVKRGAMISDKPKEGFIRTIDIIITPTDYAAYGKKYWDSYQESLKSDIVLRGIDGVEYRILIVEEL